MTYSRNLAAVELGGQPRLFAVLLWRTALRQAEALKLEGGT